MNFIDNTFSVADAYVAVAATLLKAITYPTEATYAFWSFTTYRESLIFLVAF